MSAKSTPQPWFKVNAAAKEEGPVEILIFDQIGKDWFTNDGVSAKEFAETLKGIAPEREIVVGINSPGGNVWDGLAIYNMLEARRDKVTTRIDGIAASIASVIALAGKDTRIPSNALMMIHRAWGMAVGNAADMVKMSAELDKHDGILAAIYVEKTGKNLAEIQHAMAEETWFTGTEAHAFGLVDTLLGESNIQNSFDFSRCKNAPPQLAAAAKGVNQLNGATSPASEPPITAGAAAISDKQTKTGNTMLENSIAVAPVAAAPTDTAAISALNAKITDITAQLEKERKNRISRDVDQLVIENRLTVEAAMEWLPKCFADESILDSLKKLPAFTDGAPPVAHGVVGAGNGGRDSVLALKKGRERYNFLRDNWSDLQASGYRNPIKTGPQAANTTSSTLVTDMLLEGATTVLQNRLAPLRAFSKEVGIDRVKPLAVLQHRKITAGGTAQTNATSFEDTTNFVGTETNVAITMAQITSGGHVTNAERQSGVTMAQWVDIKVAEISDAIMAAVAAKIVVGSFTATPIVSAAAAFGTSELKELWGQLKKSPIKNIILDGEYYARFLPSDIQQFNVLNSVGLPGWDVFALNTKWTGATANTVGFACNPQALVCGVGLPIRDAEANLVSSESILQLPDLGVSVAVYQWYSNITRASWTTYDIMFGCKENDTTAGVMIKSA